jgi:hypothetical protein
MAYGELLQTLRADIQLIISKSPTCSRCQASRADCLYSVEEGESRRSALRRQFDDLERERNDMRELFTVMQSCPDSEAQEIYQMMRAKIYGNDVRALVLHIRQTILKREQSDLEEPSVISQQAMVSPTVLIVNTQLPPLRSLFDPI